MFVGRLDTLYDDTSSIRDKNLFFFFLPLGRNSSGSKILSTNSERERIKRKTSNIVTDLFNFCNKV